MDPGDRELVARCRGGDQEGFRLLVERYQDVVVGMLCRAIPDRAVAEELAQDVFLRVHRGLPYFRGEARLATWIYRIVVNTIADHRSRRQPVLVRLDAPATDAPRAAADPSVPATQADDVVLNDLMVKAMATLPAHYQAVIAGYYLKGLQYQELADALGMPLGTVKTHLHRAKRLLRAYLESVGVGGAG